MVILGNILLAVASLFFLFFSAVALGRTTPGGDAAVGFVWSILLTHVAMALCCAGVAAIIGTRGAWAWAGPSGGWRLAAVVLGLLLATGGSMFAAFREGSPVLNRAGSAFAGVIFPLLITGLAILLNGGTIFRWPLLLATALGAIPCGLVTLGVLKEKAGGLQAAIQASGVPDENDLRMIREIEEHDVSQGAGGILIYTDRYKDPSVREPALAKIRSRPDWEQELADGLKGRLASEVFVFLSANDPDHPKLFDEPLRDGILQIAAQVRKTIGEASQSHQLYGGQFNWEVERLLLTLEKFEGNDVDYREAMQELRRAFAEPTRVEKPDFSVVPEIDRWLKAH